MDASGQGRDPDFLELRVHGVSGTPASSMLGTRAITCVHGSDSARFYRRKLPGGETDDTLEAYSWGGLTSGAPTRALWLLLLPFALVNVASWTAPGAPTSISTALRLAESTLRLLAFSLTCTLVTAAVSIAVDLVAWQCAASEVCAAENPVPRALAGIDGVGLRLAVAGLAPAALIVVLWWLGRTTWVRYERFAPPAGAEDGAPHAPTSERADSLADERFWCGDAPVQRLRAVHVSGAWALLAVLVTWPALGGSPAAADAAPDARAIVLVGLAVLLVSSVVVCLPSIADRLSPTADPASAVRGRRLRWVLALPWVALPLAVAAVVRLARADDLTVPGSPATGMPGITGALEIQFAVQAVAVAVLFLIALLLPRGASSMQRIPPAAHGFALPMLAAAAWLVAGGLSAAVALQVEWLLTSGSATAPPPYHFAAVTVLPLASALVVVVGVAVRRTSRAARAEADAVRAEYVTEELRGRVTARHLRRIARARAFAGLTDSVPTYLLSLVLVTLLAVGVVAAVYATTPRDARARLVRGETAGVFTAYASALMIGVAIAFFVVALLAYRYPALRRSVGVIWDLTSFWPRAVHPLAPPSYGEKAVPDLVGRLQDQATDRIVVLSAHSQGSVLAVASILQLPPTTAKNVCLLTYGSPLTRLYAAFFPRYYNVEAFTESMSRLGAPADHRAAWPWINLYRHTDPIGSWVLRRPQGGAHLPPAEVDVLLHDPAPYTEGARRWPAINGHVRYFPADDFEAALQAVVALRRPDPQRAPGSTPPEAGPR